jgi:hypothetical protein
VGACHQAAGTCDTAATPARFATIRPGNSSALDLKSELAWRLRRRSGYVGECSLCHSHDGGRLCLRFLMNFELSAVRAESSEGAFWLSASSD